MYGAVYRWWSRLIHRYGYHRTRTIYPADEATGRVDALVKCNWCGLVARAPSLT